MTFEGYFVLAVIFIMIIALIYDWMRPGMLLFSALVVLMATGIVDSEESLAGFQIKECLLLQFSFL